VTSKVTLVARGRLHAKDTLADGQHRKSIRADHPPFQRLLCGENLVYVRHE
jgi:hypothetical protein